jgi:hypothetical protein
VTQPLPSRLPPVPFHPARVPDEVMLPADADDLLSHCEGYQVDGVAGIVGVVEDVVFDGRRDRPDLLMVRRGGLNRLRAIEVPVDSVVEIRPDERRLVLGGLWQPG